MSIETYVLTESADRMDIETEPGEMLRVARYGDGIVIGTTNGTLSTSTALTPELAASLAAKIIEIIERGVANHPGQKPLVVAHTPPDVVHCLPVVEKCA